MGQVLWWEQVFTYSLKSQCLGLGAESKNHSTVGTSGWVGLPCIPRCHDYAAYLPNFGAAHACSMARGSCRHTAAWCTGCASVSPSLLGLQVPEHLSASSVPSSGQPHLDGHRDPRWPAMPQGEHGMRVGSSTASASTVSAVGLSVLPAQTRNSPSNRSYSLWCKVYKAEQSQI